MVEAIPRLVLLGGYSICGLACSELGLIAVLRRSRHTINSNLDYGPKVEEIARSEFHTVSRDLGESSWYAGGVAKRGT